MADQPDLRTMMKQAESDRERIQILAEQMAGTFQLQIDDVSILLEKNGVLVFHHPNALRRCTVPITRKSVAGMTIDHNKIYVYNNLTDVDHVELFEKLVRTEDGTLPVQRIISCPIPGKDGPRGVLQLCRKAKTRDGTRPFERSDVDQLAVIAKVAARTL